MTQETYTHILICYNCCQYEHHATKDCTQKTIICSECADPGHIWTECTNTDRQFTDHRTLAAKCPFRSTVIEDKLQKTNDKLSTENNKTYSDIAREAVRQAKTDDITTRPTITPTDKTNLKMTALILEAHIDFKITSDRPSRTH